MIYYALNKRSSEMERISGMGGLIKELELILSENKSKIGSFNESLASDLIECARNDIKNGDYWAAILDVETIETAYLQPYLESYPNLERETNYKELMLGKIFQILGKNVIIIKTQD